MKLVVSLDEIMKRIKKSDAALERELCINREHIRKIRNGTFKSITRRELQTLMEWAQRHGSNQLFTLEPHPIWGSFDGKREIRVLRGEGATNNALIWDNRVEGSLLNFFNRLEWPVKTRTVALSPQQVYSLMKKYNCVFIGSPKYNPMTEIALAALWQVEPFNASKANREKLPFLFVWEDGTAKQIKSAFVQPPCDQRKAGLYVNPGDGVTKPQFLEVTWSPLEKYMEWHGTGRDAGVLVVCRRPLETSHDVTTIVVAGYTGLATAEIARDLVEGSIDIDSAELEPAGQPALRFLMLPYLKFQGVDVRKPKIKGRVWIGPPWSYLSAQSG